MMQVSEDTKEKINQLQMFEQNINALLGQKQQLQSQLVEVESALKETENSEKIYKIIGNVMVLSEKGHVREELASRKEMLDLRVKSIDKQEERIRDKAKELQEKVLSEMKE